MGDLSDPHAGERQPADETEAAVEPVSINLRNLTFTSDHGLLKGCEGSTGWQNKGKQCPEPEWRAGAEIPVSHTMDQNVRVVLALKMPSGGTPGKGFIRGAGPGRMTFGPENLRPGASSINLVSRQKLAKKIQKLELEIEWSAPGTGAVVTPDRTSNTMYVTMGRPAISRRRDIQESGVTLRRMDTAVEWVASFNTLDPHEIVYGIMQKFPFYALFPSPKVPRKYQHPQYMNAHGGAWAMAEFVAQSGECQAIVRLIRAILWQLGIPGETKVMVFWGDPNVNEGKTVLEADWEADPSAGLDTIGELNGRRVVAALVDAPVEEGKTYPASHTELPGGKVSPGLNRYEACLKFTSGGTTRYYCGGAGVFESTQPILHVFWGLVWVSKTEKDGFRVEKIVRKYQAEARIAAGVALSSAGQETA